MQFVLAVLAGLVASECTELVPWLAARLMAWAVHHRYREPVRAHIRVEELQAVLADRPTKLLKLATALGFAAATLAVLAGRGAPKPATASRRILDVGQKSLRSAFHAPEVVVGAVVGAVGTVGAVILGTLGFLLGLIGLVGGFGGVGAVAGSVVVSGFVVGVLLIVSQAIARVVRTRGVREERTERRERVAGD
ncbi:hypothetical protein [Actinomadura macra]|uniref:hypothetical protein n=1 Tax=Actinomadura macra TaxID=46164 RepID=UPI000B06A538|nr:hypothetical protein [Actinomadura macra]